MLGFGKTRIVWDDVFEEYKCEKCGAILYYSNDFRVCPFCMRKISARKEKKITDTEVQK